MRNFPVTTNKLPVQLICVLVPSDSILNLVLQNEGFGLVVVEAGAMGVPVVASNVPGPIDAIRHEETGLIVPVKDIDALRAGLKILLSDQIKRDKFGKAANDYVCKNFDQNEFLRQVLEDKEGMVL